MIDSTSRAQGRLHGCPFLFLFVFVACAHAVPQRPATTTPFSLVPLETGLPKSGQWRDGFDVADMNLDGHLDIVHGPPRKGSGQPVIFLGDGKGHFNIWKTTHFPPLPFDYGDVDTGDVNGDGEIDIALSSHLRGLTIMIHEGGGHYAPWARGLRLALPDETPRFASRSIVLTDWNGDRLPDLLAVNEGPARLAPDSGGGEAFALFLNRNGEWQNIEPLQSLQIFGDALATGDVNADGHLDAVIGTQVEGSRLLVMRGKGDAWLPFELRSLPPRAAVTAVAVHDFDDDRRDEIVIATRRVEGDHYIAGLDHVRWSESGETPLRIWEERSRDTIVAIAVADLDGDGSDDVAAVRQEGSLMLFAGRAGGFAPDAIVSNPEWLAGCYAWDAHAADVDGDGRPEIIVSFAGDIVARAGPQCTSGGGFVVWRVQVNSAP